MSRPYSTQPTRSAARSCPDDEAASARQQTRVLAWVVGSVVAMHLLVVVGVLWLANAQFTAQAERNAAATAADMATALGQLVPPQSTERPSRMASARPREDLAMQTPSQPAHWSQAVSKDRPAPWRTNASGHVVPGR